MTNQLITASYSDAITINFTSEAWFNATEVANFFGKKANEWLRLDSTKEYIVKLGEFQLRENPAIKENQLVKTKTGSIQNGGGTWLHPKLAVPFARWLDVGFSIWCDMQIEKILHPQQPTHLKIEFVTKDQREPLVKSIRSLVKSYQAKGRELSYSDAHKIVNLRLGVEHIDQLTAEQLPQALTIVGELLQALVIEEPVSKSGFVRPAIESSSHLNDFRLEFSAYYKSFLWNFGESVVMVLEKKDDELLEYARKFCNPYYPRREIEEIRQQLATWSKMVDDSELLCNAATVHLLASR